MNRIIGRSGARQEVSALIRAASLFFLLLLYPCLARAEAGHFLDYLYVEANDGDSSGGHAALRFDRYTFHFQHEDSGIIRMRRYDSAAFEYAYAKLGNRPIHQSRIAVTDDTYRFIEDTFTRLLLVQDARLEYRDALERDVHLLEAVLGRLRGESPQKASFPVPAAGYFLSQIEGGAAAVHPQQGAPALAPLREKVAARYGADFFEKRDSALVAELAAAELTVGEIPREFAGEGYPPPYASGGSRFYGAAAEKAALGVLQGALPLRPGSLWRSDDGLFTLSPEESGVLSRFADQLEDDLLRLVQSRRTDRGVPLLVGLARLCAVRESLATGRLVFLDFFGAPPAAEAPELSRSYYLPLGRELRQAFQRRRDEFFTSAARREADYTALERTANLLLEVRRAEKAHTALRKPPTPSLPARAARFVPPLPATADAAALAREVAVAREREEEYRRLLKARYSYDLVRRNCVTELFGVLNRSMAGLCEGRRGTRCTETEVREESVRRLGGHVDGTSGLVFIPVLSDREVAGTYRVASRSETPSYRQEQLALMREKEAPVAVFLRESNTLTSTLYRPGPDDSFFLFFTDDAGVLRPLFGAFNMVAGVGESLYGLVSLPVAGKRHLVAGVKGILFSVPELFFLSIRKGSIGYLERGGEGGAAARGGELP